METPKEQIFSEARISRLAETMAIPVQLEIQFFSTRTRAALWVWMEE